MRAERINHWRPAGVPEHKHKYELHGFELYLCLATPEQRYLAGAESSFHPPRSIDSVPLSMS